MPIPEKESFEPRKTAKERVYNTLRQWIIDGTLEPDERLNDSELAKYFSVSRTPVREALLLLSEQKLVKITPSSGTFVAPFDEEDLRHVYDLLSRLQSMALETAVNNITGSDFEKLEALNETFLKCALRGTAASATAADYEFHHQLCVLSGNPYIVKFSDQLAIQAQRNENRFFMETVRPRESYETHKGILEDLKAGRLAGAQSKLISNWTVSIERSLSSP